MYVRIELDDPSNLEGSLKTLRASLPKVVHNYFPYKKMVGAGWYGFNFIREDPLLDWRSISTWCEVSSETSHTDECCDLHAFPPSRLLAKVAPTMIELIRKEREVSYNIRFYTKKYKRGFEVELSQLDKQLQVEFDFFGFLSSETRAIETLKQAWSLAQKHVSALKHVNFNFGKKVTINLDEALIKSGMIKSSPNRLTLTYGGSGIRTGLSAILKWAVLCEPLFEVTSSSLSLQLLPGDAVKISQQLSEVLGEQLFIHFDGAYRLEFHPDQVLKDFPPEGYWVFPMFAIRGSKENWESLVFNLIQTPKERFIEANAVGEKYLEKIRGKVEFKVFEGAAEKRWSLHKLRKNK